MARDLLTNPYDFADQILDVDLDDQPPQTQRLLRYIWARLALDDGSLTLMREDHVEGVDCLVCALPEDGSCHVVERPPEWSHQEETRYLTRFKQILEGTQR